MRRLEQWEKKFLRRYFGLFFILAFLLLAFGLAQAQEVEKLPTSSEITPLPSEQQMQQVTQRLATIDSLLTVSVSDLETWLNDFEFWLTLVQLQLELLQKDCASLSDDLKKSRASLEEYEKSTSQQIALLQTEILANHREMDRKDAKFKAYRVVSFITGGALVITGGVGWIFYLIQK